jgi:LPXTG-motif cell wall-anchored protein
VPTETDLLIHKYLLPEGTEPDGADTRVGAPLDPDVDLPAGATQLGGIEFAVYSIHVDTHNGAGPDSIDFGLDLDQPELYSPASDTDNPYPLELVDSITTGDDGIAAFDDIPNGFYLIVERPSSGYIPIEPFIIELPFLDPVDNDDWLGQVHVYAKNYAEATVDDTVSIVIDKVDARLATKKLAGAKFKIAYSLTNALTENFIQKDEADWEVTTDEFGSAVFTRLTYGKGEGEDEDIRTYYLVETQAPAGYNALMEPVAAAFDGTEELSDIKVVRVLNGRSPSLPRTGGVGTWIFTALGVAIICGGVLFLLKRKGA